MTEAGQLPADHRVRNDVLSPEQSFLVEAPAGSGKTGLLTARFLRLLATVDRPEQVLAITFTLSAVSEMRERVLRALESARRGDTPQDTQEEQLQQLANSVLERAEQLGWRLLEMPTRLNIKTIDALALEIASQLPLLSRLSPSLEPDEQPSSLYHLAATRTMRVLEFRNSSVPLAAGEIPPYQQLEAEAAWQLLQHLDNDLPQCVDLLAEMLGNRDQWLRHFQLDQAELSDAFLDGALRPDLERQLRNSIQPVIQHTAELWGTLDKRTVNELIRLANHAGESAQAHAPIPGLWIGGIPEGTTQGLPQWLGLAALLLTNQGDWRKTFNVNQGFLRGEDDLKQAALDLVKRLDLGEGLCESLHNLRSLPPDCYTNEQWALVKSLFRLLRLADSKLREIFAETGRTDFVELNLAAIKALRDKSAGNELQQRDPASALGLQHILVDEFQDTSRTQHELLELMVADWHAQGARTLFLVGDPMQSIYAFRQAEVRLFSKTSQDGIGNLRPLRRFLTVNFRAQPSLVEAHNDLFPSVFDSQSEVAFTKSVSFLPHLSGEPLHWHFSRKPPQGSGPQERAKTSKQAALEICDQIARYTTNSTRKIAILLRVKRHGDFILAELRRRGIHYRAVDLEMLNDRQEVLDIAALTRALIHPADRIAWLSVLRAPWCGLTLASLETLCGLELHKRTSLPCVPDLLAERVDLLEGEDAVIAARVRDVLMPALANRMKLRLPQLVSQTWRALGGAACVDAEQLANVNAFLRLLDDLDRQNISIDASTLDDAMGRLCAPPDPEASDQIQVMTIHKAKGLTFDVVIVPGMDKTAANDRPALLEWIEDDASPEPNLLLSPMASVGDDKSPLTKWIAAAKRKRADAELRRMFYVAATRAREYVHFFAAVEDHDGKLRKPRSNSLLSVAWKAVEGVAHKQLKAVPELLPAMAAEAEAVPSAQNLIRRLPKDWHPDRSAQMPIGSNAGDISSIAGASSTQDQDEIEERGDSVTIAASIAGRAVGTLVHSLLEQAAERIAGGESISATTSWVESRSRNIQNSLRMLGVPKAALERSNRSVLGLVRNALNSTTGRWVLAAHPEASNELRISVAATAEETQHRLDRVFLAGPEPLAPGNSHVWIVDYKTTSHAQQGLEEFLQARQQIYDPTIHAYAVALRALRNDRLPIICALYYMALDRLEIVALLDP